jgi:hypothetical protein
MLAINLFTDPIIGMYFGGICIVAAGWLTAVWLACLRHERLDEQGRQQRRQDATTKGELTMDDNE